MFKDFENGVGNVLRSLNLKDVHGCSLIGAEHGISESAKQKLCKPCVDPHYVLTVHRFYIYINVYSLGLVAFST